MYNSKDSDIGKIEEIMIDLFNRFGEKGLVVVNHSIRVSEYSAILALELGINKEDKENLEKSALLHDIGKIIFSEKLLEENKKLSETDKKIIITHPELGYAILSTSGTYKKITKESLEGVLSHHERYDGTGYPRGLKGNEINLIPAIIAITDSYDACNTRLENEGIVTNGYKTVEKFIECLPNEKEKHFHPYAVEVFLEAYPKIKQKAEELKEKVSKI